MKEQLNDQIELGLAMNRLLENPDFKKVFLDGYIKSDLEILVSNMAKIKPESRVGVQEQLISRANFRAYCNNVMDTALSAKSDLEELALLEQEQKEEEEGVTNGGF